MAKGKGALFSLKSQGRIGDAVYMRSSRGEVIASKMPDRRAEPTAAQTAARLRYAQGCALWHTLTGAELAYWQDRAGSVSTNGGFSEFMQFFLNGGMEMQVGEGLFVPFYDYASWNKNGEWQLSKDAFNEWHYLRNYPTPLIGDWIEIPFRPGPGTWQLLPFAALGAGHGISEFFVDGVSLGTYDFYTASTYRIQIKLGNTFEISDYEEHILKTLVIGKNPAASYPYMLYYSLEFMRVA